MKDRQKIGTIIPRLNRENDAQNWLSMQPNPLRWYSYEDGREGFGEVNENNKLLGRGIEIWNDYDITIGYFDEYGD